EKMGSTRKLRDKSYGRLGRLGVLVVAFVAAALAISPSETILALVGFAWAGFGASFGPIVLLALFWRKPSNRGALAGLITGAVGVMVWGQFGTAIFGEGSFLANTYEIIPGFIAILILAGLVSRATYKPNAEIEGEFDRTAEFARPGYRAPAEEGATGAWPAPRRRGSTAPSRTRTRPP